MGQTASVEIVSGRQLREAITPRCGVAMGYSSLLPLPLNNSKKSKEKQDQEKGSQGEMFNEIKIAIYVGKMIWEHSLPFKPTPISKNVITALQIVNN